MEQVALSEPAASCADLRAGEGKVGHQEDFGALEHLEPASIPRTASGTIEPLSPRSSCSDSTPLSLRNLANLDFPEQAQSFLRQDSPWSQSSDGSDECAPFSKRAARRLKSKLMKIEDDLPLLEHEPAIIPRTASGSLEPTPCSPSLSPRSSCSDGMPLTLRNLASLDLPEQAQSFSRQASPWSQSSDGSDDAPVSRRASRRLKSQLVKIEESEKSDLSIELGDVVQVKVPGHLQHVLHDECSLPKDKEPKKMFESSWNLGGEQLLADGQPDREMHQDMLPPGTTATDSLLDPEIEGDRGSSVGTDLPWIWRRGGELRSCEARGFREEAGQLIGRQDTSCESRGNAVESPSKVGVYLSDGRLVASSQVLPVPTALPDNAWLSFPLRGHDKELRTLQELDHVWLVFNTPEPWGPK
ncbi:unnamed protein product [Symbiodinium natans]|uniref:Uncharacterized protein n=1 Tax=Symbiodinium natans TaxID=878477 RepID=A0A812QIE7_9DINO|nr:unnamed protein product [Symbiodinium natans]